MSMELLTADARKFFARLSEKEKRLFAGLEANRLGQHGVQQVSEFYHIHPHTVRRGKRELAEERGEDSARVRCAGGGRKLCETTYPELDTTFLAILREHTAGDPMQEDARWTYLDNTAIRDRLHTRGCPVSIPVVTRLLKKHKYGQRRMVKRKTFKQDPDRNTQFEQIQAVTEAEAGGPNPILSMDTKKKSISGSCIGRDRCMSRLARTRRSMIIAFQAMRQASSFRMGFMMSSGMVPISP
jgi:hypothetical protein